MFVYMGTALLNNYCKINLIILYFRDCLLSTELCVNLYELGFKLKTILSLNRLVFCRCGLRISAEAVIVMSGVHCFTHLLEENAGNVPRIQ